MTFEVGQKVVYPNHGVSVVEEISAAKFDEIEQTLYHLRLLSNNSKVMVPKDNLDLVGLRPLGDKAQLQAYRNMLATVYERLSRLNSEGVSIEGAVGQKPLADLEKTWGNGIFTGERWLSLIYDGLE